MTETPTSSVEETENPDTAPSKESAETTQQEKTPPNLAELMEGMSDFELVSVGLVAMAILHKRGTEEADG